MSITPSSPKLKSVKYDLSLVQAAPVNGQAEWYLALDGERVEPPTIPEPIILPVTAPKAQALAAVIAAWDGRWMP